MPAMILFASLFRSVLNLDFSSESLLFTLKSNGLCKATRKKKRYIHTM